MTQRPLCGRRAGLTLIETAIASGILVVVLGIAAAGTMRAIETHRGTMGRVDLERRAASALERIVDRLTDCGASAITEDLTTPGGSSRVTFRRPEGWSGAAVTMGPLTSVTMDEDPSDPVNGADDDADGVIDQRLVQVKVGTAAPVAIARNVLPLLDREVANGADDNGNGLVDEPGFCVTRSGEQVTVRISLRRRGPDGVVATASASATVRVGP